MLKLEEFIYIIKYIKENKYLVEILDEDYKFKHSIKCKLDKLSFNDYIDFIEECEKICDKLDYINELNYLNKLHEELSYTNNSKILKYVCI